jgi:hypothetical protein
MFLLYMSFSGPLNIFQLILRLLHTYLLLFHLISLCTSLAEGASMQGFVILRGKMRPFSSFSTPLIGKTPQAMADMADWNI